LAASDQRKTVALTSQGKLVGILEAVTMEQLHERAMADPQVQTHIARTEEDLANGRTISARDLPIGITQWPDGAFDE